MTTELQNKILKTYREDGVREVIKRVFNKGVSLIFETNSAIWYEKVLNHSSNEIKPAIPLSVDFTDFIVTLNWIKNQDVSWMLNKKELNIALYEEHYWLNIKHKGLIIGYIKVGLGNVYINDYKGVIKYPDDVAYIYDSFILPEFRNKRAASYFIYETCNFIRKKGFKRIICHIPQWNIPSIRAYSHVGFKKKKSIRWVKIVGFKILTFNPANL